VIAGHDPLTMKIYKQVNLQNLEILSLADPI
jgi:hypothetical protein